MRFQLLQVGLIVLAHLRADFLNLSNRWTHCGGNWCVVRHTLFMRFAQDGGNCTYARAAVHTFKHIYSLPIVHRPKKRLTVMLEMEEAQPISDYNNFLYTSDEIVFFPAPLL